MSIFAIMAHDETGGIGKDGALPWPRKYRDLMHFKKITSNKKLLVGRKTFETLPSLPDRETIVVTSNPENFANGVTLEKAKSIAISEDVYIVGGAKLYKEFEALID